MQYVQEIFDVVAGNVWWVDSAASATAPDGSFNHPLLTVQAGVDRAVASNGDLVLVKAGHAETLTVQIDFDKAGVAVRGLGKGNSRPTLTANADIDTIDVSAANCTLENFIFAAPGASADGMASDVKVDAAGFTCRNCRSIGSDTSVNKDTFFALTANADDCEISGFRGHTDVVDMINGVTIAALTRLEMFDCKFSGDTPGTIGYTGGVIEDSGTANDVLIHNCYMQTQGAAGECITFGSNSIGVVWDNRYSSRHNTLEAAATLGSGCDSFQSFATANVSLNGAIAPVVDAD
jgi:hypothetical protein